MRYMAYIIPSYRMLRDFNAGLDKDKVPTITIESIRQNKCKITQEGVMPNNIPHIIPVEQLIALVGCCRLKNISLLKGWYVRNDVINTVWCDGESFELWEEKNEDTAKYYELHGICHEFVLQHSKDNDKYIVWLALDDEIGRLTLLHCFIQRDDIFIDTRGATRDKMAVYEGFEDWDIVRELVFNTKEQFSNFLKQFSVMGTVELNK